MTMTISGTSGLTFPSGGAQTDVSLGANNTTQTYQNVTASRASSTTYTNSTGRAISVLLITTASGGTWTVNGVSTSAFTAQSYSPYTMIIPAGATYSYNSSFQTWTELR